MANLGKTYENIFQGVTSAENPVLGVSRFVDQFSQGPLDTSVPRDDTLSYKFSRTNTSYSGTDCIPVAQINDKLIILGNVQTFTYSTYREKTAIRTLGRIQPKGFVSGPREIAGTLIFTVFDRNPLYDIITQFPLKNDPKDRYTSPLPDQIPAFDLSMIFVNEYGSKSIVRLYAIELFQEGTTHSINDIYSECVMQYKARDMDIMTSYDDMDRFKSFLYQKQLAGQFIDNTLAGYIKYKDSLQRELVNVENEYNTIEQELNKRLAAGIATVGITAGVFALSNLVQGGPSNVTANSRAALKERQNIVLSQKNYYMREIEKIDKIIIQYEQTMTGWNAHNTTYGSAGTRDIRENQQTTI